MIESTNFEWKNNRSIDTVQSSLIRCMTLKKKSRSNEMIFQLQWCGLDTNKRDELKPHVLSRTCSQKSMKAANIEDPMKATWKRSMYGTQDAINLWQKDYTTLFESHGYAADRPNPPKLFCEELNASLLGRGDDIVFLGKPQSSTICTFSWKKRTEWNSSLSRSD